jgi:pyruvate dehydrogenase E2 component (dihydrolipoamide acetyltransferase)
VTEFKVPELGENVAGGDVMRVMVNVGDTVARDQPVMELETDKATIEVPSTVEGTIKEVRVKKGDKVQVGAVVFTVDENGASRDSREAAPEASTSAAPAAPADTDSKEAPPREPHPQTAEAPAEPNGSRGARQEAPPRGAAERRGDGTAAAERDHKVLSMPPRAPQTEAPSATAPAVRPAVPEPRAVVPASPAVRRLAREIGIRVDEVQGTGPGGRISQDDVKDHARRILSGAGPSTALGAGSGRLARALPDFEKWGAVERQPWSNIRRVTAEHLSYAWNAIPHVTQFDKADITGLDALRRQFKDQVAKAGGNLTVTAMLVRVLAAAVRQFPQFNASIDPERGELIYKKYVNVGVAVDTDRGLLVPVIRNADQKNITQIAIEIHQAAEKARDRKLTLEEMSGGGITVSNLGGIGGTYFTPIVNWPEVAILGVSRGVMEPVWKDSSTNPEQAGFEPRLMLPLALSYDHRVIDGADAVRFLRWVVDAIQQPFLLSLIG